MKVKDALAKLDEIIDSIVLIEGYFIGDIQSQKCAVVDFDAFCNGTAVDFAISIYCPTLVSLLNSDPYRFYVRVVPGGRYSLRGHVSVEGTIARSLDDSTTLLKDLTSLCFHRRNRDIEVDLNALNECQ